jgi:hypothetical protein
MVWAHLRDNARALLLIQNRLSVTWLRFALCVYERKVNVMKGIFVGHVAFTVYALASLLSGLQDERFQTH